MYKQDLALKILQALICNKNPTNQPTNQQFTNENHRSLISHHILSIFIK